MYGKIFESIYDGTLAEDWRALITFEQMLILCNSDGVIDMTPRALSRRTGIPIEHIETGIEILEAPDRYSRTPGEDGRRIIRLDEHRPWGWQIVNHRLYRDMRTAQDRSDYMRQYMRNYRGHQKKNQKKQQSCKQKKFTKANSKQKLAPLANEDADENADENTERAKTTRRATALPPNFEISKNVKKWAIDNGFTDDHLRNEFAKFTDWVKANGKTYKDWDAAVRNWLRKALEFSAAGSPQANYKSKRSLPHWSDDKGWEKLGNTIGVRPGRGEDWSTFKARVRTAFERETHNV